jgi:hypothetical protein
LGQNPAVPAVHQWLAVVAMARVAAAEPPRPRPTVVWLLTQLLPSPGIATGAGGASLDLRWQVTPVLYSFAVNHRVSPWRFGVVDPFARFGGSIELYVDPDLLFAHDTDATLRPGMRVYVPVHERGESLSASLGLADQRFGGRNALAIEAGAYIAFGVVGVQLSYAPVPSSPGQVIATLSIRYF